MPSAHEVLQWWIDVGVDETIGDAPVDRYRPAATPPAAPASRPVVRSVSAPALALESADAATASAEALARSAHSLDALRQAMAGFDACALKHTATNLVFGDGAPDAVLMCVGEAPGADEDREGRPFVGVSGQLLDRMLASIGYDRSNARIANILPWRPPGNRKPTAAETAMCLPFIRRQIELVRPKVLLLVGGVSLSNLFGRTEGIQRLRGRWLAYETPEGEIPAMPIFHPAFLLRTPARKREAWLDLLAVKRRLDGRESA
jgi:DNA polymerase